MDSIWSMFEQDIFFIKHQRIIYCFSATEAAVVCAAIHSCDRWFTVCCQEGAVTSILQREFVWGLPEDTKISLHLYPPSPWHWSGHYTCSCLNITPLVFFILPFLCSSLAFSVPMLKTSKRDEFRRDSCSTDTTGDVHIWCSVVMSTVWLGITHLVLSGFEL